MNKQELENRLIDFAVLNVELIDEIPNSKTGNHISGQLIRSATAPALNYGEARSAESLKDFIHKLQIVLKELRESFVALKIIRKAKLHIDESKIRHLLKECDELISIFVKSVQTANKKRDLR
jgi:four helix bundle protein